MTLPWKELIEALVYALFVYAVVDLLKDVRHIVAQLAKPKAAREPLKAEYARLTAFAVAYLFCTQFDYGLIQRVVEVGERVRPNAFWLDYAGTSALIAMGSAWLFDKIAALKAGYAAVEAEAEARITKAQKNELNNLNQP